MKAIGSFELDRAMLETVVAAWSEGYDSAIETMREEAACFCDWHRSPFDDTNNPMPDGSCGMCGEPRAQHELVPCCSPSVARKPSRGSIAKR
jgi:hypothetical protein